MSHLHNNVNRRVLVIDDNRAIHADFKKILCPQNTRHALLDAVEAAIFGNAGSAATLDTFQVDSAFQGREGLGLVERSIAEGRPYAVVFMDVRMPPGWDGIETTAHIWGVAPETQIVLCTAFSDYSWDEMVTRLGISDRLVILKKPFDNMEVVQLTHALAEKWRLRQEAQIKMEQLEAMVAARTQELQLANAQLKHEMAERDRINEALRQSQKMEALGQLAGGVAHDFNNLLTIIRSNAETLLAENIHTPETMEILREIDAAAERASQLTSQILTFSRKRRLHCQEIDLHDVVGRATQLLARLLGENVRVQINSSAAPLPVQADPVMIDQVLLNLATNARDAMPDGGRLTIDAREARLLETDITNNPEARPGAFASVSVTDTGSGIPPEVLPRVFDPFFTVSVLLTPAS